MAHIRPVGVFLEGEGLTDNGAHLNGLAVVAQANTVRAGGLNQVGADLADGYHGHAGFQGKAGDTDLRTVAASVGAAGTFGVDADHATVFEDLRAGVEGFLALLAAGTVHGQLADTAEERRHSTTLHAGGGEVVALGEEVHGARHGERNKNGVAERQVVAGDNVGTLGQILEAHHVMVVQSLQQGGAKNLER